MQGGMSSRIQKARAIRAAAQRKKNDTNSDDGIVHKNRDSKNLHGKGIYAFASIIKETLDQIIIDVGVTATIVGFVFLLAIGANLMTGYIMMKNPGCMSMPTSTFTSASTATSSSKTGNAGGGTVRGIVDPLPVSTLTSPVTSPVAPPVTPPTQSTAAKSTMAKPASTLIGGQCTEKQREILKQQLPATECQSSAWSQKCSFTLATIKSGCHEDTFYLRQPLAEMMMPSGTFTGVFIGVPPKEDDSLMDFLALGSHLPDKYKISDWKARIGGPLCPKPPVTYITKKSSPTSVSRLRIIDPDPRKVAQANSWKSTLQWSDTDLLVYQQAIAGSDNLQSSSPIKTTTLNQWYQKNMEPNKDIQYLLISSGDDPAVLAGAIGPGGVLERVWYLEFTYDWKGGWNGKSLKEVLEVSLPQFDCYFHGASGNVWKITSGCWLNHFGFNSWAHLVCVNRQLEGAAPIHRKIEAAFTATLQKNQVFS